ncbi:MAG: tetratricopeptide repeat protein [Rubrivivax sp.]
MTSARLDELKRQLAQVDELAAQGVLGAEAAKAARAKLEQAIVDVVADVKTAPPKAVPAAAPAPQPAVRLPRRLLVSVAAFVLVFGAAGYAWQVRGDFSRWGVGPGEKVAASEEEAGQAGQSHTATNEQIQAMVDRLAERLKAKPDDADGWALLGRSYTALGRGQEALAAYRKVVELRPNDAQALADLADGMAVTNNRSLEGEPERLILQAVKLDPTNVKALALAGTVAFNRSDYAKAADFWQKAIDNTDPSSEFKGQLQQALNEARQRAGLPVAQAAPAAPAAAPGPDAAAAGGAGISGRVSLAPALMDKVAPGDTVFIFARAVAGPKMPLAILRKQVSELPFDFTLDDSLAMSPAARLSSAQQVVVGARVSKSGNAVAQPGDLQVLSAPVGQGTRGLKLEIAEVVR